MMAPAAVVASFPGDMGIVRDAMRDMSRAMRNEIQMIDTGFRTSCAA